MKFTRKELKKIFADAEIEVPADVLGQLCDLHTSANDDLVEENKTLNAEIEKITEERDELKKTAPKDGEETVLKKDYDKINQELTDLKNDIATKETKQAKQTALRNMYKAIGVSEKRIDTILKVTQLDSIELEKDGTLKNAEELKKTATEEWADFIETDGGRGAKTPKPPADKGGGTITKEQFEKMSYNERVKLFNENRAEYDRLTE